MLVFNETLPSKYPGKQLKILILKRYNLRSKNRVYKLWFSLFSNNYFKTLNSNKIILIVKISITQTVFMETFTEIRAKTELDNQ